MTRRSSTRTYTFAVNVNEDTITAGIAICHRLNGETGEGLDPFIGNIGRKIARYRLANNPIDIRFSDSFFVDAVNRAIQAGQSVTLHDLIGDAILNEIKANGFPDDNAFEVYSQALDSTINRRNMIESERVKAEEDAAWSIRLEEEEKWGVDNEWNPCDDTLAYIDYSDRY